MSDKFEGFEPPTSENSFPVPEEWLDAYMFIQNYDEFKIVHYLCFHTARALAKNSDLHPCQTGVSKDELLEKTGLSEIAVNRGIKLAIQDGYLLRGTNNLYVLNLVETKGL